MLKQNLIQGKLFGISTEFQKSLLAPREMDVKGIVLLRLKKFKYNIKNLANSNLKYYIIFSSNFRYNITRYWFCRSWHLFVLWQLTYVRISIFLNLRYIMFIPQFIINSQRISLFINVYNKHFTVNTYVQIINIHTYKIIWYSILCMFIVQILMKGNWNCVSKMLQYMSELEHGASASLFLAMNI